jgi:hypothetical protein
MRWLQVVMSLYELVMIPCDHLLTEFLAYDATCPIYCWSASHAT